MNVSGMRKKSERIGTHSLTNVAIRCALCISALPLVCSSAYAQQVVIDQTTAALDQDMRHEGAGTAAWGINRRSQAALYYVTSSYRADLLPLGSYRSRTHAFVAAGTYAANPRLN